MRDQTDAPGTVPGAAAPAAAAVVRHPQVRPAPSAPASAELGGVRFDFVPAHHWSKRSLLDACRTLWGGWILTDLRAL